MLFFLLHPQKHIRFLRKGFRCPNDFGGRVRRQIDFGLSGSTPVDKIKAQTVFLGKGFWCPNDFGWLDTPATGKLDFTKIVKSRSRFF